MPRQDSNLQVGILIHGINLFALRLLAGARGLMDPLDDIKRGWLSNPIYEMASLLLLLHSLSTLWAVLSVSPGQELKGVYLSALLPRNTPKTAG